MSFDDISVLLLWTAIAIYTLGFLAFTVDLARRSELAIKAQDAKARTLVAAGGGGQTIDEIHAEEAAAKVALEAAPSKRGRYLFARLGVVLTTIGFLFHVGADVTRGIAAGRVPWSNNYEFALTGTMLVVMVFLTVLVKYDLRFLGAFINGLIVILLGGAALAYYVEVVPLSDPLKSVWLVIHVFVASLASAFFALAFALSIVQLLQSRRERIALAAVGSDAAPRTRLPFLRTLPSAEVLESLAYRFAIIGFVLWTFTLIAGAIWANDAWGRYWGFDTKEVWTFVIWVVYAGYIHARATRGWRGTRSAWLSIVGFTAVLFNFTIVNQFFQGLHSYSGLPS
ncbi:MULTISPECIES: c-type cytochrome biogenesis protein CcsB [Microbacterium]|uniref:C-type cytochrome biogenesis protein CcsB n=1 Tax=Microbacterium aquilitoris TaxID=3067307 RepID=A0ABU3GH11_9MICO|nr:MULTISPECIES: c-type cytochrome biogenesis protein CcsB [unclassified Microbacterium]MDT3329994.1 c-type cytochrome biogenesis protein CcsB [Microbacterium sp. KSW-18]